MTRALERLNVHTNDKATSILVVGYRKRTDGAVVPEFHRISNAEDAAGNRTEVRNRFDVVSFEVTRNLISWAGCADVRQSRLRSAHTLLTNSATNHPRKIVKELVSEIRVASERKPSSIGQRCSSIAVSRKGYPFLVDYHVPAPTSELALTANIVAEYGNVGAFVALNQTVSQAKFEGQSVITRTPVAHKRQPCPCGSGKMYKKCHGNAGSVHCVDRLRIDTRFRVFADPEDGSDTTMFSSDMLGG
jgi:hypothetical protein